MQVLIQRACLLRMNFAMPYKIPNKLSTALQMLVACYYMEDRASVAAQGIAEDISW